MTKHLYRVVWNYGQTNIPSDESKYVLMRSPIVEESPEFVRIADGQLLDLGGTCGLPVHRLKGSLIGFSAKEAWQLHLDNLKAATEALQVSVDSNTRAMEVAQERLAALK